MDDNKFKVFSDCFETAFCEMAKDMVGLSVTKTEKTEFSEDKKFSVIIGTVGQYKGRILFEAGAKTVKTITETMNGEPFTNTIDIFLYLAEFTNIFCGHAITLINNKFKGSELRLTPPAVFSGSAMEVETPNIDSRPSHYKCELGNILLDIGFEEV